MDKTIQELATDILKSIYEEDRNIQMRKEGYVQRIKASDFIKQFEV